MFQWTDGEVSHVVKLVLESVRSSAINIAAPHRSRLIEALAGELDASAWHAQAIDIDSIAIGSTTGDSISRDSMSIDAIALDRSFGWTMLARDLAHDWSDFHPCDNYALHLRRLLDQVRASACVAEEVVHSHCTLPPADEHHGLAWLAVEPEGRCACVEFLKPASAGPFTLRDEAVLRILSTQLLLEPAGRTGRCDSPETAELADLPRRQREVLTQLLAGSSVKEIASELGISPYTVNDYIKALYRRYQVSSRGELMAAMHGLRRPVAPK